MADPVQGEQDEQALWDTLAKEQEEAGDEPPLEAPRQDEPSEESSGDAADPSNDNEGADPDIEAKGEEPKAEEADPYAGLHPKVRERLEKLEALEAQQTQLLQEVKTANGRVAAMQREMAEAKNAAKAVSDAPTQAQIAAASTTPQEWETLKEDFPEWAKATESFVNARLAGLTPQQAQGLDQKQVEELIQQQVQQARDEARQAIEEAKVDGKYEGWRDVIKTDDFANWFKAQPADVQTLAASKAGRDAIRMLDLFHEAKAKPTEQVQQGRAAKLAAAVTGKPGDQVVTTKSVDQMTPDELWDYELKRQRKKSATQGLIY